MTSQIATNMAAVRTHNVFAKNNQNMATALDRVSTGLKVKSVADDISKYAISERMRERINANEQASQNVQNDSALSKTASSGLENTISILKTLKARALDAANDSNTDSDRALIQKDIDKLVAQIDYNATNVRYNGKLLLDGSADEKVANATRTAYESLDLTTKVATQTMSETSIGVINTDINSLSTHATLILSWTNAKGELIVDSTVTTLNGSSKISDVLTAANGQFEDGYISAVTSKASVTDLKDKNAIQLTNESNDAKYFAVSSKDGIKGRFSNLKIEVVNNADVGVDADSRKYGTYTFSFGSFGDTGLVQRGKDQNDSSSPLTFQIGEDVGMSTKLQMEDMSAKNLGISGLNVKTQEKAEGAITAIEDAFNLALQQQTSIGAMEQRLGYTADTLDTMNENLQAADSALRDADMSKEISNYMKWNILAQASQYMLAQSNQNAFQVLNLLQ